jgi:hypothetical protein
MRILIFKQGGGSISDEGVKRCVIQLLTDEAFLARYLEDRRGTLERSGFELNEFEIGALTNLDENNVEFSLKTDNVGRTNIFHKIVHARTDQ